MTDRNLENLGLFGMIVTPKRAIAIGAIAQLQPHPSGAVTITFVGGKEILLEQDEADVLFKNIDAAVLNARYAAAQVQNNKKLLVH